MIGNGSRIIRRLTNELGIDNYKIDEQDESDTPIQITYRYRNSDIQIYIGPSFPFHQPKFISNWQHSKYKKPPNYYSLYTGQTRCQYCEIMEAWSPCSRIDEIIGRFIALDRSISNCVKVNVLFRNVLCLPEDLIPLVLSYLEGMDGLSFQFRACAY